jgi:hypothetical protein
VALGCTSAVVAIAVLTGVSRVDPAPSAGVLVYAQATSEDAWLHGAEGWIWRANADGTDAVRLTRGDDPLLSPDEGTIVYRHAAGMWTIPVAGGTPRLVMPLKSWHEHYVAWTAFSLRPGTDEIAFDILGQVRLVDAATGASRRLRFKFPKLVAPRIWDLSFSPDGRALVLEIASGVGREDGRTVYGSDLYVADLPGDSLRRVTTTHRARAPVWGPSGIAFGDVGPGHPVTVSRFGDIWEVSEDGTGLRRLTHGIPGILPAAWSADGTELLAYAVPTFEGQLYAVDAQTAQIRTLTPGPRGLGGLLPRGLSADGTTVLASLGCDGTLSPFGAVETIPWAGGSPTVIVKGPCGAVWSR